MLEVESKYIKIRIRVSGPNFLSDWIKSKILLHVVYERDIKQISS